MRRGTYWYILVYTAGLAAAEPAGAQFSPEWGLVNFGQLATEVTHRVRASSMPGSLMAGVTFGRGRLAAGLTVSFTSIAVTRCAPQPCEATGRDYRPGRTEPIEREYDAVIFTPRAGVRLRFAEVGVALPMLQTAYSLVGASPMLVVAPYAGAELRVRAVALFARAYAIPPQGARWTAFSEHSGLKQVGKPFPNGRSDPVWIVPLEAGVRINGRPP